MAELPTDTWRLFLTVHARLLERIERVLADAGLPSLGWYDVLLTLEEAPQQRLRMFDLAAAVLISRSNLTRLVDRLEDAGLIKRESCAHDRRGAYAALTAAGKEMRRRMWPVYREQIKTLFNSHLSERENTTLNTSLTRILTAATNDEAQAG